MRLVLCSLVLLSIALGCCSCQHVKLHVNGDHVEGPGYRFTVPAGFVVQTLDPEAMRKLAWNMVSLRGPADAASGKPPSIVQTDDYPSQALDATDCEHAAVFLRDERAANRAHDIDLSEVSLRTDNPLGPVCTFQLHDRADQTHAAFRLFYVILDGATIACDADQAGDADALCDGYLASYEKPGRFDW